MSEDQVVEQILLSTAPDPTESSFEEHLAAIAKAYQLQVNETVQLATQVRELHKLISRLIWVAEERDVGRKPQHFDKILKDAKLVVLAGVS